MDNFFVLSLIKAGLVAAVFLTPLAYLQWVERKVLAHIQLRPGPYRVGPHGLLQPLADVIKLLTKEGFIPANVNKFFYLLAPFLAVTIALISISVIPFGPQIEVFGVRTNMGLTDLNIGILFILALSSVGVYGVALAGWASNNKYALLGGLRSAAQMICYELPMALAMVAPLLMLNTLSLREMVNMQDGFVFGFLPRWTIFQYPFPQISQLHHVSDCAFRGNESRAVRSAGSRERTGRRLPHRILPMSFAAFFMAEYANMITVTAVATLLFLGGWHPLFPTEYGSWLIPVLLFIGARADLAFARAAVPRGRSTVSRCRSSASCFIGLDCCSRCRSLQPMCCRCSGLRQRPVRCCSSSSGFAARCRASATTS